jgi:hypothetical protein
MTVVKYYSIIAEKIQISVLVGAGGKQHDEGASV